MIDDNFLSKGYFSKLSTCCKAIASGGGGRPPHPVFGRLVNPSSTEGAHYAQHITTGPTRHIFRQPCSVNAH